MGHSNDIENRNCHIRDEASDWHLISLFSLSSFKPFLQQWETTSKIASFLFWLWLFGPIVAVEMGRLTDDTMQLRGGDHFYYREKG